MSAERILGIDPGLNLTGYGVIEIGNGGGPRLVEAGVVRGTSSHSVTRRVHEIHAGVKDVIRAAQPRIVAVEELYAHYKHPKTAILMGHARGVICLAAAEAGLQVQHYAATQIKKLLTGNGRAPKWQMQLAIQQELQLSETPEPADVADALAIALCHHYVSRTTKIMHKPLGRTPAPLPSSTKPQEPTP